MSFYHNPKIITDQLVFYIDAKNTKSYTSGSWIIKDLTSEHTASFVDNGPVWYNDAWQINYDVENYAVIRRESIPELNFSSGDFTAEVWCRPADLTNYHQYPLTVWNNGGQTGTNEWLLAFSTLGVVSFAVCDASNTTRLTSGTINHSINEWVQVVGVRNGTTISVYTNGKLEGTPFTNAALSGSANTTNPLYIGAFRNIAVVPLAGATAVFSGSISMVKIYKKALSSTEIEQNYVATKGRFGL